MRATALASRALIHARSVLWARAARRRHRRDAQRLAQRMTAWRAAAGRPRLRASRVSAVASMLSAWCCTLGRPRASRRVPFWVYTDPDALRARAGTHLRRAGVVLRRPGGRDPGRRATSSARSSATSRSSSCATATAGSASSSTAARTAACSSASADFGTRAGVHVSVPPVDLRPARPPRRRAAAARPAPAGRHAGGLPPRRPRPRSAWRSAERHGVVFASFDAATPPLEDYLGADDAAALRPRLRRPRAARARLHAPAHPQQLEADVREHQGPVPRQPAARVPRDVRPVPRRPAVGGDAGRDRPARGAGLAPRRAAGVRRHRGDEVVPRRLRAPRPAPAAAGEGVPRRGDGGDADRSGRT